MSGLYFNAHITFGLWDKIQDSSSTVLNFMLTWQGGDKISLWWLRYISWQRSASTNVGHVKLLSPFKVPLIWGFWTQWGSYQGWKQASVPHCQSKDREQQSQLETNACLQYLWHFSSFLNIMTTHIWCNICNGYLFTSALYYVRCWSDHV